MRYILVTMLAIFSAMTLVTGCSWSVGSGKKTSTTTSQPTVGQQLIDLQKAKDSGAISESEYQTEKARILGNK